MMPIGVPRVPYRTPKEGGWQWVDIWNCLVSQRAGRVRVGTLVVTSCRQSS